MRPIPHWVAVRSALGALGGEATLGDLLAVTALARAEVERALDELIATGGAHVRVSASGDVVYHLGGVGVRSGAGAGRLGYAVERKTAQLIRAREGVLSIAELVEHTGLRVADAEHEMLRLAERFGGVPHVSLDGHVVHAFPDLVASAHGRFLDGEPRPAWVRMQPGSARGVWRGRFFASRRERLRRQLLGPVFQTALAGKGVVSLERARAYLRSRERRAPARAAVERALRELAVDFDAPVTRLDGDLFFGFRSVKRQFLASHLVRRRLRLRHTAEGEAVFDTADSRVRAAARDLEAFDRELRKKTMTAPP
jgi:hypothetical protein